uniref:Putative secreted protein n=1 Tax=Anopheles marajoara TaxID=58244 RepID=A0A2M4CCA6_9DIPT
MHKMQRDCICFCCTLSHAASFARSLEVVVDLWKLLIFSRTAIHFTIPFIMLQTGFHAIRKDLQLHFVLCSLCISVYP